MHLRFNYFEHEIDHEALIDTVPAEDKWVIDFNEFKNLAGTFADTISRYMKTEDYTLLKDPKKLGNFQVGFYFNETEYAEIKKYDPEFSKFLYHYLDRLAEDDEGNLYDIDDQEPTSFNWYCYFLSTPKQEEQEEQED